MVPILKACGSIPTVRYMYIYKCSNLILCHVHLPSSDRFLRGRMKINVRVAQATCSVQWQPFCFFVVFFSRNLYISLVFKVKCLIYEEWEEPTDNDWHLPTKVTLHKCVFLDNAQEPDLNS